jgi:hypothetical protein
MSNYSNKNSMLLAQKQALGGGKTHNNPTKLQPSDF